MAFPRSQWLRRLEASNVRLVPEDNRPSDSSPSHRVMVGRAEIGAGWTKTSIEGRSYIGLKLDDPSFNAPIHVNLFDDGDGKNWSLIWSRQGAARGRVCENSFAQGLISQPSRNI